MVQSSRKHSSRLFEMDMVNPLAPAPPTWCCPCLASSNGKMSAPSTEYTMTRTTSPGVEKMTRIPRLQHRLRLVVPAESPISCSICSAASDISHASQILPRWAGIPPHHFPGHYDWWPTNPFFVFRGSCDVHRVSGGDSWTNDRNFKQDSAWDGWVTISSNGCGRWVCEVKLSTFKIKSK